MGFDPASSPLTLKTEEVLKGQSGGMETGMDATVQMQAGTATPGGEVGAGQQDLDNER